MCRQSGCGGNVFWLACPRPGDRPSRDVVADAVGYSAGRADGVRPTLRSRRVDQRAGSPGVSGCDARPDQLRPFSAPFPRKHSAGSHHARPQRLAQSRAVRGLCFVRFGTHVAGGTGGHRLLLLRTAIGPAAADDAGCIAGDCAAACHVGPLVSGAAPSPCAAAGSRPPAAHDGSGDGSDKTDGIARRRLRPPMHAPTCPPFTRNCRSCCNMP